MRPNPLLRHINTRVILCVTFNLTRTGSMCCPFASGLTISNTHRYLYSSVIPGDLHRSLLNAFNLSQALQEISVREKKPCSTLGVLYTTSFFFLINRLSLPLSNSSWLMIIHRDLRSHGYCKVTKGSLKWWNDTPYYAYICVCDNCWGK